MPDRNTLAFVVRTPHEVVVREVVKSLRIPTETGQVGLRPRTEGTVLAVESGVVTVHTSDQRAATEQFVGVAGGLLTCDGRTATLFTPLAVMGDNEEEIVRALDRALQQSNAELEARTSLSKLEGHILTELRREQQDKGSPRVQET